jgi:transcriptional regulator
MYTPPLFQPADPTHIREVMRRHPFATLLSTVPPDEETAHGDADPDDVPGQIVGSHLPLLLRPEVGPNGQLAGHMARKNPQWRHFETPPGQKDHKVLAIFHGPHAYVSPSFYRQPLNVPTWNYVTVHAYGIARVYHDPRRLRLLLDEMIAAFESPQKRPWQNHAPDDYMAPRLAAIVGFDIDLTRVQATFKLNQNRQPVDREGAALCLASSSDSMSREVAGWMRLLGVVPDAAE